MSQLRPLPSDALHARPCPDGSVTITDIASGPDGQSWRWRLALIGIDANDLVFPTHDDVRRQFVPLDAAVDIRFHDGRTQPMNRFDVAHFDHGNAPRTCQPASPTRTFNLMLRDDAQGELIARPLNGAMVLLAPLGWRWFVLLLSGRAQVIVDHLSHPLEANDMLWIDPIPGHPVRIEGGGEILLARLPAD